MTKEDIEIEAQLYEDGCHNPSVQKHFKDGAEWAMNKIIDKACDEFAFFLNCRKKSDLDTTRMMICQEFENWTKEFRKAMEK